MLWGVKLELLSWDCSGEAILLWGEKLLWGGQSCSGVKNLLMRQ
ncbi:MAG TPA: hypothetical protein PLB63_03325 [Planctomycetota bacterium]|nr:hypothetical protein [Planctomycetota bacterium]HQA99981.1 hypothetical protein [Planctomycetota bacterium]